MSIRFPIRGPSIESMRKHLGIATIHAQNIKAMMDAGKPMTALKIANRAMDAHGVESLYPDYPAFYYVNMGDTYSTTLCYTGNSFYIGSWGDWVERHPGRGGKRQIRRRCR